MTPTEFRAAREEMGLDRSGAAKVLCYSAPERISEIENGKTVPARTAAMVELLLRVHRHAPQLLPDDWPKAS